MIGFLGTIPLQGLLPLEGVMPGWPEVSTVNPLHMLLLAIGIPAIILLIITFLCKGQELRERSVENGVAVGLPASNQRVAIERGSEAEADFDNAMALDAGTPDNPEGSSSA